MIWIDSGLDLDLALIWISVGFGFDFGLISGLDFRTFGNCFYDFLAFLAS